MEGDNITLMIREQDMELDVKINDHDYNHEAYTIQFKGLRNPSYVVIRTSNYPPNHDWASGSTILSDEYMAKAYTEFDKGSKHRILCIRDEKDSYKVKKLISIDGESFIDCTPEQMLSVLQAEKTTFQKIISKLNIKRAIKRLLLEISANRND